MIKRKNNSFLFNVSKIDYWLVILLIVLSIFAYGQVATHGLNGLDDRTFLEHEHVEKGLNLENIKWSLQTMRMAIWHPLTWWSYQVESSLFGATNTSARHLVNLVLHILATIMCYLVVFRLFHFTSRDWSGSVITDNRQEGLQGSLLATTGAFLVAFLFAFHPQHVQVLAWVSERKELLAALFSMLAIYAHMRSKLLMAFVWFALSLLSKASALPMAFVIIFYDIIFNGKGFLNLCKQRWVYYISIIGMAIGLALLTLISQSRLQPDSPELARLVGSHSGFNEWLGYIVLNLGHYLKTLFVPWPLPIFIHRPVIIEQTALINSLIMMSAVIVLLILFRKNRWVLFGALWFGLFWLPTSGVVNIGDIYVADRYMYQAHIGAFIVIFSVLVSINSLLSKVFFSDKLLVILLTFPY